MANTDIFNPNTGYTSSLGFNPNWNYGGPRKVGANYSTVRPRFGQWQTRSVGNAGYSFDLVFVDRPIQQVWYIKQFYERFQNGFFTLIDYDNNARNHVGRFTAYSDDTHTANLKFTIRVTFEEIPGCPMQQYPSNWAAESQTLCTVDDWISTPTTAGSANAPNMLVGTSGASWVSQQDPNAVTAGLSASDPTSYEAYSAISAVGDFAQFEYLGWGCGMMFRMPTASGGGGMGVQAVYFDGTLIGTLDQSSGFALTSGTVLYILYISTTHYEWNTYSFGTIPFGWLTANAIPSGATYVGFLLIDAPLGRHRVKVMATGQTPAVGTGTGIAVPSITVMR